MTSCTSCQSSNSAHLSVLALASYQQVCQMYGVTSFPAVYIPTTSSTTTSAPGATDTATPAPDNATTGTSHSSGLASGAIAGIIVSGIALIVALAVAGYVYARRKRELERQKEDDELYKYQETTRNSYMETPLPQYTGIQSSLPALPQLTNLRVMNPDNEEEDGNSSSNPGLFNSKFDPARTSSPGWRRGSFDDD
ncbi:hypothetical protein BGZ80_011485 [Entomortierella chlamydospora]|uniref:Uncharacterized protein n=1 Tax=Entomortierella chlamydospora TaxID=101097 RepID=A0A9P6N3V1_9FUNG|nr:hypothetical protein BGZ79_004634 [Entomortierella chlamydospora]KAG0022673.1 hypothetical protein BGZ80_011485 [Entomortierella chlamydospora]